MRTILYDAHVKLNANIVDFHGWDMPLYYESIIKEHMYVREKCGIFDVSHMGDIFIEGEGSTETLMKLLPTDISKMNDFDCVYSAFLNDDGNIIDDTIIYKFNNNKYLCVPNAATTNIIYDHIMKNKNDKTNIKNESNSLSCIAVQGKLSSEIISKLDLILPKTFKFYIKNDMIISGTGYTGEEGCEIIVKNEKALSLWNMLIDKIKEIGSGPCGLGSRDTLRMEKGMLLSGQDFHLDRNPYEASISFIVNLDHEFIGESKILNKNKPEMIFRGFIVEKEKFFPRQGNKIYDIDHNEIGIVTSGSISPILKKGIALGYINKHFSKTSTSIYIDIRNNFIEAKVSRPRILS
jgi:aminomethyltransferase